MSDQEPMRLRLTLHWRAKKPPEAQPKWSLSSLAGKRPTARTRVRTVYMDAGYTPRDLRDLFESEAELASIHEKLLQRMENERKKEGLTSAYLVEATLGIVTGNPRQTNAKQVMLARDDYWHSKTWADAYKKGGWLIETTANGAPRWEDFAASQQVKKVHVEAHERKWPSKRKKNPQRTFKLIFDSNLTHNARTVDEPDYVDRFVRALAEEMRGRGVSMDPVGNRTRDGSVAIYGGFDGPIEKVDDVIERSLEYLATHHDYVRFLLAGDVEGYPVNVTEYELEVM